MDSCDNIQFFMIMAAVEYFRRDGEIVAGTTMRGTEACAEDAYSGFSLCHYTGDLPEHWRQCKAGLARELGVGIEKIIVPRQTHSTVCKEVVDGSENLDGVDAVVTRQNGMVVGVNTADCVPVLLADLKNGVIGASHAGWRGAVKGVVEKTVKKMTELGAEPSDMQAWIGPCICRDCFEVGDEVAAQFPEEVVIRNQGAKPQVDLRAYVASRLQASGIGSMNITISPECTRCTPMRYFSARALGIKSGRNYSFIMLPTSAVQINRE